MVFNNCIVCKLNAQYLYYRERDRSVLMRDSKCNMKGREINVIIESYFIKREGERERE